MNYEKECSNCRYELHVGSTCFDCDDDLSNWEGKRIMTTPIIKNCKTCATSKENSGKWCDKNCSRNYDKWTPIVPKTETINISQLEKEKMFIQIATEVAQTLIRKNHDYGDSFHKIFEQFGDLSTFIRLTDKMGRMETLVNNIEPMVENEPLDDVYKDMAGYCILTLTSKAILKAQREGK